MGYLRWYAFVKRIRRCGAHAGKERLGSRTSSIRVIQHPNFAAQISGDVYRKPAFLMNLSHTENLLVVSRFSSAVDSQQSDTERRIETDAESIAEEGASEALSDAGVPSFDEKPVKLKKEKLPTEVSVRLFFERTKSVEQVVNVLRRSSWSEETERALEGLSVTYNTQLATAVLRVPFPCDVALGFFQWLKKQDGFKHTEYTYGVLLNTLGRAKHFTEMQEVLGEMKSEGCTITPVIISCIMHWYASVGDAPNVRRLWERLKRAGTRPSLGIYTAYLDLLIRVKWFTKIPHVYEKMLSEECLPNSRMYTLFIQHLADDGRLRAAVQILEIMQKVQVVPSRLCYEYIIQGYAKAGDAEKVQELLITMRERFHRPSKRLMPAVKVLQQAGKSEEADLLIEEIGIDDGYEEKAAAQGEESSREDPFSFSEDGDSILDSVMCAWRDVTSPIVGFDVNSFAQAIRTWNLAVEAELDNADVQWHSSLVLEVLRRLRSLETSWPFFHWVKTKAGFKHDKYTCMVMIQRILKSRSSLDQTASLAEELFEGMQNDGIKFTVPMFNMLIRQYVLSSDVERVLQTFNRITDYDLEPDAASYSSVIQAFARDRQGRKAIHFLNQMQDAGFHPDSATCAELITCLELAERLPDAYKLFCKIPESGRTPGPLEYKAIMAAYSRAGDQKMALKLYEEMRGAGIKPTQDMFDEVSVILKKANREYDINTIANFRRKLSFFGGKKKALQEDLLKVLDLFMRSMKPRPNNAYASLRKLNENSTSNGEAVADQSESEAEGATAAVAETEILATSVNVQVA